jgi:hypothetical protein
VTIAKRVVNIIRSNVKSHKTKYPATNVLKELHKHERDLSFRLDAIEFSEYILNLESTQWGKIVKAAEAKQSVVIDKQQVLADRLVVLSRATEGKYSERESAVEETVQALRDTLTRIQNTIVMVETDQDLRSLTNMLSLDNFGGTTFDIHAESREIRSLLHTADALLELNS